MFSEQISVVIPTRNRFTLLERAVSSALAAGFPESRIVIVDDQSTDGTAAKARRQFPRATVIDSARRGGPGMARNRGLNEVTTRFALMLDDDDTLQTDAHSAISGVIEACVELDRWPVLQFATATSTIAGDYRVLRLEDYISQKARGDFSALIQLPAFRRSKLAYPESVIGGESLLWFRIARDTGIPTWRMSVITVNHDAGLRLCSVESQMRHPREYAASIEALIERFGSDLQRLSPEFYRKKLAGAGLYRLLAGERGAALRHALSLGQSGDAIVCAALVAAAALPAAVVRRLFGIWRQRAFA